MGAVSPAPAALSRLPLNSAARPEALDFLRAVAVGLVGWFHIWQQSWLTPHRVGFLPRTGYAWVDCMILLSALCLWLPYARARVAGVAFPGTQGFYRRRAVRILPSYYAAVLLAFVAALAQTGLTKTLLKDLLAHLTLTHMFFLPSYYFTQLNGALWTVGLLCLFYLLFPLLARAVWRWPLLTGLVLLAAQALYSVAYALPLADGNQYKMAFNQLPAFLGVLALGIWGAEALAWGQTRRPASLGPVLTGLGMASLWGACLLLRHGLARSASIQHWQLAWRLPMAALFCAAALFLSLGVRLPGAKLWALCSALSYNYYIWHQWLAVKLKYGLRLPFWQGDTPPNQLGDTAWMWQYQTLAFLAGLAAAVFFTFLVEKPLAKRLKKMDPPLKTANGRCKA